MDEDIITITKNLATCTGVEFLRQSNKIRHAVEGWLKETGVLELRKRKAQGKKSITNDMTPEEKQAINLENHKLDVAQAKKNVSDMLDVCLDKNPEDTLKVLAMMCFVEPQDAEKVKPTELLANFGEMMGDDGVMRFFLSLMKWEAMFGSN